MVYLPADDPKASAHSIILLPENFRKLMEMVPKNDGNFPVRELRNVEKFSVISTESPVKVLPELFRLFTRKISNNVGLTPADIDTYIEISSC